MVVDPDGCNGGRAEDDVVGAELVLESKDEGDLVRDGLVDKCDDFFRFGISLGLVFRMDISFSLYSRAGPGPNGAALKARGIIIL